MVGDFAQPNKLHVETSERFKSTEATALTKEETANRAEADKILLNVWDNEPGDPRYRRNKSSMP